MEKLESLWGEEIEEELPVKKKEKRICKCRYR